MNSPIPMTRRPGNRPFSVRQPGEGRGPGFSPQDGGALRSIVDCRHALEIFTLDTLTPQPGVPAFTPQVYPKMWLVNSWVSQLSYALLGLQLSSSLSNFGTNVQGIFVTTGRNMPSISMGVKSGIIMSHVTTTNSFNNAGTLLPIPATKCSSLAFGEYGRLVPVGTRLNLYVADDGTDGNAYFGLCSFQMIQTRT
jgi:hypothetical protein